MKHLKGKIHNLFNNQKMQVSYYGNLHFCVNSNFDIH